jgi:hypothetical protein
MILVMKAKPECIVAQESGSVPGNAHLACDAGQKSSRKLAGRPG